MANENGNKLTIWANGRGIELDVTSDKSEPWEVRRVQFGTLEGSKLVLRVATNRTPEGHNWPQFGSPTLDEVILFLAEAKTSPDAHPFLSDLAGFLRIAFDL
ncbi:MAG: hypothetical protein Q7S31_04030 [bacterium]|nr:hypothetical protein [bacterium]